MVKIQFDLPEEIDKFLKIQKVIKGKITKADTIKEILRIEMKKYKHRKNAEKI